MAFCVVTTEDSIVPQDKVYQVLLMIMYTFDVNLNNHVWHYNCIITIKSSGGYELHQKSPTYWCQVNALSMLNSW
jgi:hypothetical protein